MTHGKKQPATAKFVNSGEAVVEQQVNYLGGNTDSVSQSLVRHFEDYFTEFIKPQISSGYRATESTITEIEVTAGEATAAGMWTRNTGTSGVAVPALGSGTFHLVIEATPATGTESTRDPTGDNAAFAFIAGGTIDDSIHVPLATIELDGDSEITSFTDHSAFTTHRVDRIYSDSQNIIQLFGGTFPFASSVAEISLSGIHVLENIWIDGLSASRLVSSDASKNLISSDFVDWVAGTSNQVIVTDDTNGGITLSLPQNIHSGAVPDFDGLNLTGVMTTTNNTLVTNLNADYLDGQHAPTGTIVGTTDAQTLSSKTLTTPTISSFINANHTHAAAGATGGTVSILNTTATLTVARGGTGLTSFIGSNRVVIALSPTSLSAISNPGASRLLISQTGVPTWQVPTITISGEVDGSASMNSAGDWSISTTVDNNSHEHTMYNVNIDEEVFPAGMLLSDTPFSHSIVNGVILSDMPTDGQGRMKLMVPSWIKNKRINYIEVKIKNNSGVARTFTGEIVKYDEGGTVGVGGGTDSRSIGAYDWEVLSITPSYTLTNFSTMLIWLFCAAQVNSVVQSVTLRYETA